MKAAHSFAVVSNLATEYTASLARRQQLCSLLLFAHTHFVTRQPARLLSKTKFFPTLSVLRYRYNQTDKNQLRPFSVFRDRHDQTDMNQLRHIPKYQDNFRSFVYDCLVITKYKITSLLIFLNVYAYVLHSIQSPVLSTAGLYSSLLR